MGPFEVSNIYNISVSSHHSLLLKLILYSFRLMWDDGNTTSYLVGNLTIKHIILFSASELLFSSKLLNQWSKICIEITLLLLGKK